MIGIVAIMLALASVPAQAAPIPDESGVPVRTTGKTQSTSTATMTITSVTTTTDATAKDVDTASEPVSTASIYPNPGEGIISMVTRTCGSSANWQGIAAANTITPPDYVVRLGRLYQIDCSLPPDPTPPAPVAASNPTPANNAPVNYTGGAVAGLDETQTHNARIIVQQGLNMGLPERAMVIAIATALQESSLYNLANPYYPESYNYNPEGSGYDHDSVGLFQQRSSSGWGSVPDLMNPWYAAGAFYNALIRFNWWDYSVTGAAQHVQGSAYPYAYAKWENQAWSVVDSLL